MLYEIKLQAMKYYIYSQDQWNNQINSCKLLTFLRGCCEAYKYS